MTCTSTPRRDLAAEVRHYQDALPFMNALRKAIHKREITQKEFIELRKLAIAGYLDEATKRLAAMIAAKYERRM